MYPNIDKYCWNLIIKFQLDPVVGFEVMLNSVKLNVRNSYAKIWIWPCLGCITRLNHINMVHMKTKVERQIKRKGSIRFQTNSTSSSSIWRPNLKREGVVQLKPYAKTEPSKAKTDAHMDGKGKSESQLTRDRDIKCFKSLGKGHITSQCPNRRVMLPRDNGEVEFES